MIDFSTNQIAIYTKNETISYRQLFSLIKKCDLTTNIFYAPSSVETIVKIIALLLAKKTIFPLSPREPKLPNILSYPNTICTCLQTSGTTNKPKFAMHTWENHYISATNPHPDLKLIPSDKWFLSLPLNHIGGFAILLRTFLANAAVILPDAAPTNATHISFVPTQLKRYLKNPYPLPHLKAILLGGAPIPESLCQMCYQLGLPLYLTYGMTEMSSQIATQLYNPSIGITFGSPLTQRTIKIFTNNEVWVKGKTLFTGYLNQPLILKDGYFNTKDIGEMTKHGLIIKGRKDRMIISGGENIYLEEIEQCLMNISEISQAFLSSRRDPEFGQRPVAHLPLNKPIKAEKLQEKLQETLPKYKIPFLDDFVLRQSSLQNLDLAKY